MKIVKKTYTSLRRELNEVKEFEKNWDLEGSEPYKPEIIDLISRLIDLMENNNYPAPILQYIPNELGVCYTKTVNGKHGAVYVDISNEDQPVNELNWFTAETIFDSSTKFGIPKEEVASGNFDINDGIPEELKKFIFKHFGKAA